MRQVVVNNLVAKQISRGKAPNPVAMLEIAMDFSLDTSWKFEADMAPDVRNKWGVSGIQSVFIDNSLNAAVTTVTFDNGFVLKAPAYSQAVMPVFNSGATMSFVASSTGGVAVTMFLTNSREQAALWAAQLPIAGTVSVSNSVVYTRPNIGATTDASAALTTGGTAQLLLAANAARQGLLIRNPASAASQGIALPENVYLGFSSAGVTVGALGSWELLPGEQLPQALLTTTEAIYWVAATTGHRLTAKYF